MRISWLEPRVIHLARTALARFRPGDWDDHFSPEFLPPPPPDGVSAADWPQIAEHVARAERVGEVVREQGLESALAAFARSDHAIEVATLISAVSQVDTVSIELLESLLSCDVDELVVYGTFLALLVEVGRRDEDRAVALYERFCTAVCKKRSDHPMWNERVAAVRDGLASFYVTCGRHDDAHRMFTMRHREQQDDLIAALAASRAFLAAGATGRAVVWLGYAAERARTLGRPTMERKLRQKEAKLRERMS